MKHRIPSIVVFLAALGLAPIAAQEAASSDDIFGEEEQVAQTTEQTQNAAPRDEILTSAVPWITGSFTGKVGLDWNWSDIWASGLDLANPSSYGLSQSATNVQLSFVARPQTDISVAGQVRASYPFVREIEAITSVGPDITTTYTIPDFTVWSLYSKFNWRDSLFFSFGKQPIRWGTGYVFSPADDIFAQSEVDISDPTAEREGPLALRFQYPIPTTMHNLYAYAVLPRSADAAALAAMKPEDIAVAAKAEFFFGNTEVAAAGYYQREQRPRAVLMATTGTGDFNFFAEGVAAFPGTVSEPYVVKTGPLYSTVDKSGEAVFLATGGVMYSNQDWEFTAVGQYLYNGYGYDSLSLQDLLLAAQAGAVSFSTLASTLGGLGRIGQHYAMGSLGWTSLWDSDWDFSVLAIANLSDGSGYVKPTVSLRCLSYVTLSGSASFSWGGSGTEFADPAGLVSALSTGSIVGFVSKPSMALSLTASIGTTSF